MASQRMSAANITLSGVEERVPRIDTSNRLVGSEHPTQVTSPLYCNPKGSFSGSDTSLIGLMEDHPLFPDQSVSQTTTKTEAAN